MATPFALALLLALPAGGWAFHVPEHLQITNRAVALLSACGMLPATWTDAWTATVDSANEEEDYDLIRKWYRYSHYYHPLHGLKQYRVDSSVSVQESVATIRSAPQDADQVNRMLGRIVHHVQDSSVPAHVVPVAHAWRDGYELVDSAAYFAEPLTTTARCAELSAVEPMEALHANALATLDSLSENFTVSVLGRPKQLPWLGSFWVEGEGESFGAYGPIGNSFGEAKITLPGGEAGTVDTAVYTAFKRARVDSAVRATAAVILWVNKARTAGSAK